jgi:hypothetical protein
MFTRAACPIRVVSDLRGTLVVTSGLERLTLGYDRRVELSTLLHVGLDEELAAALEKTRDFGEEEVSHDQALAVSFLPPWIGEVEKDASYGLRRLKTGKRRARVLAKDTCPLADACPRETPIADGRPLSPNFQANERGFPRRLRALDEKPSRRARADLELDEVPAYKSAEVDRLTFWEARRVCVGAARSILHGRITL